MDIGHEEEFWRYLGPGMDAAKADLCHKLNTRDWTCQRCGQPATFPVYLRQSDMYFLNYLVAMLEELMGERWVKERLAQKMEETAEWARELLEVERWKEKNLIVGKFGTKEVSDV